MLKLTRFYRKYFIYLLVAVLLLFSQAILDLELPNVMSEIVNNGIQKGGITEIAPKAISENGLTFMSAFMPEADKTLVADAYVQNASETKDFAAQYPNADAATYLLRTDLSEEESLAVDTAFGKASYAFIHFAQAMAEQQGEGLDMGAMANEERASMDVSVMYDQLLPMLAQLQQAAATELTPEMQAMLTPEMVAQINVAKEAFATIDEAIAVAATMPEMATQQTAAVFTKGFYTELGADTDAMQTNYILITGAKMLGLCVLVLICAVCAGYCLSRFGAGVARDMRSAVFRRVTTFTNNEMDQFSTASLITRTTNDITQVQMFLTMGLRMLCFAPIMGIGGLLMAVQKSVSMSWIIALALTVMLCLIGVMMSIAMPRFKKMQTLIDKLNLVTRENLSGMMVIRAFATQQFEEDRFDKANKDLNNNNLFVSRAMVMMMPIVSFLFSGITLLIIWVGGHQIAESNLQIGDMMAFMQYAMHVIMSFMFVAMMFVMLPRASVSAGRIAEVLNTESTVLDPETPKAMPEKAKGRVAFNNVSFRYKGADEDVLSDISFVAEPGKTTAFIGSTGSGKSTLINLLPRFYDVTQGSITIDGVDIRDITQHTLRQSIGYVPQKGVLFSGTIESNLLYGDETATQEVLAKAAEVAQATEFINKLDDAYQTNIAQGGTNVSGGQRQRLSIARALVKNAPIYIFDDTFSALDFKTDAALRAALKSYTENATVLIVAQRISTIMTAEQIVVLDEGRIAGIGTHAQLLKSCTPYREIAQSQLSEEELNQ